MLHIDHGSGSTWTLPSDVGHTWLELQVPYQPSLFVGFWPGGDGVSSTQWTAPGFVEWSDTSHRPTYSHRYELSVERWRRVYAFARDRQRQPGSYDLRNRNCTTFAVDALRVGGVAVPSPRSITGHALATTGLAGGAGGVVGVGGGWLTGVSGGAIVSGGLPGLAVGLVAGPLVGMEADNPVALEARLRTLDSWLERRSHSLSATFRATQATVQAPEHPPPTAHPSPTAANPRSVAGEELRLNFERAVMAVPPGEATRLALATLREAERSGRMPASVPLNGTTYQVHDLAQLREALRYLESQQRSLGNT